MDIERFTDRARGFLQAAQTIAIREHHQRVTPEHLLKGHCQLIGLRRALDRATARR